MKTNGKNQRIKAPRPQGRGAVSKLTQTNPEKRSWVGRFSVPITRLIRHHRLVLRSCLIFIGCLSISIFVYSKFIDENSNVLIDLTARVTGAILSILGNYGVQVDGSLVSSNAFSMRIVMLCTGVIPIIIFVSAVIAYPCKIKPKITGAIIGSVVIFLLNLIRMVSLFYIGSLTPGFFETAHMLIWQSLMILLTIVLWLFWVENLAHGSAR